MINETPQERVAAGMAWLDEHYPNHVKTFKPDNFDIMCRYRPAPLGDRTCVIMQATGKVTDYDAAINQAGFDILDQEVIELGFYPNYQDNPVAEDAFGEDTDALNAAWLAAYAQRQGV
jgi:hypothetical protein